MKRRPSSTSRNPGSKNRNSSSGCGCCISFSTAFLTSIINHCSSRVKSSETKTSWVLFNDFHKLKFPMWCLQSEHITSSTRSVFYKKEDHTQNIIHARLILILIFLEFWKWSMSQEQKCIAIISLGDYTEPLLDTGTSFVYYPNSFGRVID